MLRSCSSSRFGGQLSVDLIFFMPNIPFRTLRMVIDIWTSLIFAGTHLVCIEIDGYKAHHKDINRWQFADQLTRQNHLILDGWKVLRFAYDEMKEKPRRCQQLILQMMGSWFGEEQSGPVLSLEEKEILRIAGQTNEPLLPKTISIGCILAETMLVNSCASLFRWSYYNLLPVLHVFALISCLANIAPTTGSYLSGNE